MEELKQKLIALVNETSQILPAEAIYYVVKDFYRDIEDSYTDYLQRKQLQKENEEKSNSETEES